MDKYRNYDKADINVENNYKIARTNQTYDFVKYMHGKYLDFKNSTVKLTILEALDKLSTFIDLSDPDMSLPNIVHLYQTAERMRKDNLPDWLQLVGLIHDLGKIIYIKGCPEDGTSIDNQFAIVGDTFIVGYTIPNSIVYNKYNCLTTDKINNIYIKNMGLDNCKISFGHDEYLYNVLKYNNSTIPQEGLNIIRYHSLYVWHTNGEYRELMNKEDYNTLEDVNLFNKYDLYTKENINIITDEIKKYYIPIIEK